LENAPAGLIEAGRAALSRGAWEEARTQFQQSLASAETATALEQLGLASWWLDDAAGTFDARERAYRLYRDANDARGAARVALWLVWDYLAFRGDTAVSSGWLERARRILEGHESTSEYGLLLLREGEVALFRGHDPAASRERAARAAALGRTLGDRGLEFTGLALEGLALVSAGDVPGGMRKLDEATAAATAGEIKEMHAVGQVCCWQIFACERVRDFDRAAQWCARALEFSKRWRVRPMSAICRAQFAGVLIWRGAWGEAEQELTTAARELDAVRPATAGQALARLGELRLRQGRLDEAAELFARSAGQMLARLGKAALALERGDPAECVSLIEQLLKEVGESELTTRSGALELAVRAHAAAGDVARSSRVLAELEHVATTLGTPPLAAALSSARGLVCGVRGDHAGAARNFEEAVERYLASSAPFEAARARLDLARTLEQLGRRPAAEREARAARDVLRRLGGAREAARADAMLKQPARSAPPDRTREALTPRQVEILRLVAQGLSNPDIAVRLKLSDHTVKRHVANLLSRLGLSSRAAAAAYAARQGLL
jgi:LuxR family transcriptional regulator, maltose regulon positive regulatory protein